VFDRQEKRKLGTVGSRVRIKENSCDGFHMGEEKGVLGFATSSKQ